MFQLLTAPPSTADGGRNMRRLKAKSVEGAMQRNALKVLLVVAALSFLGSASPTRPQTRGATITRDSGGSVRIDLGHGIVLNKDSSLRREWITIHHQGFPADLQGVPADLPGTAGVETEFAPGQVSGEYRYVAWFDFEAKEPLTAINVRFLLFDVWGRHTKTLSFTEVADLEPGKHRFKPQWRILSENEASQFYASICYVAKVRTKSGRIVASDITPVLEEARKFSSKFSAEDLEPKTETDRRI